MKRSSEVQVGEHAGAHWVSTIHGATSAPEVVKLCAGYLALWGPDLRARLPESCQPPPAMKSEANVSSYAFHLVHERLRLPRPSAELDAMATFFAAAATRLAQLLAAPRGGIPVPFFNAEQYDTERE